MVGYTMSYILGHYDVCTICVLGTWSQNATARYMPKYGTSWMVDNIPLSL